MTNDMKEQMIWLAPSVVEGLMRIQHFTPVSAMRLWQSSRTRQEIIEQEYDEITPVQAYTELAKEMTNSPTWFKDKWLYSSDNNFEYDSDDEDK